MTKYQKNNLIFRIASSDAISKFKSSQAHSFLQLARKELNFSESARETVLLEFDRFSSWIMKIEKLCISINEKEIPTTTTEIIVDSFFDELSIIEDVMRKNSDVFSKDVIKFTNMIHSYTRENYLNVVQDALSQTVSKSFSTLTEKVNDYLQHVLVSMHEYNSNLIVTNEKPFIAITDFCINIIDDNEINLPCVKRINFYLEKRKDIQDIIVKNYSSSDIDDNLLRKIHIKNINLLKEDNKEEEMV